MSEARAVEELWTNSGKVAESAQRRGLSERGEGEGDHVNTDGTRVALLRAAVQQTPEHGVAQVDDGVRMAARAPMTARSVGWIKSRALVLGVSVRVTLARLRRRDSVSPPHSRSNSLCWRHFSCQLAAFLRSRCP